jgi:hypothetical protein
MKNETKVFYLIERRYVISSKEVKKALNIEGEVLHINLWTGRSQNDVEDGISPDVDNWEIETLEKRKRI